MSLDDLVDPNINNKLFRGIVFQTILEKLPATMPTFDRLNHISKLREEIGDISLNLSDIPWHKVVVDNKKIDAYIEDLSLKLKFSYEHFLCPPTNVCKNTSCKNTGKELSKNHVPTQVILCTTNGLKSASSYSYRCRHCKHVYSYDMYGLNSNKHFYGEKRPYVRSTQMMYIERNLMEFWRQLSLHSQVSFESIAICYNYAYRTESKLVSQIFETYGDDCTQSETDEDESATIDESETEPMYFLKYHLNRKQVSSGFWVFLIEEEYRESSSDFTFCGSQAESFNSFMDKADTSRRNKLYGHTCQPFCEPRACSKSTSMDGIWKIRYVC